MPTAQARKLCPQAVFVAGSMRRYADESRRIFEIFARFTPAVQGLSLDEAFLDLTGTERLLGPPRDTATRLRAAVRAERGLAVSVGIAPVKLVAKIASDAVQAGRAARGEGRRGARVPRAAAGAAALGRRSGGRAAPAAARLPDDRRSGRRGPASACADCSGPGASRWRASGAGRISPRSIPTARPSRTARRTPSRATSPKRSVLESAIGTHADSVARRLRRDGVVARTVVLKLKLGRRVAPGAARLPAAHAPR